MKKLNNVTLICVDCVDSNRAIKAIEICERNTRFGAVKLLTSIEMFYLHSIIIPHISSIRDYSRFMIKELHKYITTSHALCIQWDAFILNPDAWDDSWLQYDYIGAPWWFTDNKNVGNGGFSLRSKKFLEACSTIPGNNIHPEDISMCRVFRKYLESKGITFAPEEVAAKFAIEGNSKYGHKWQGQFGFHDLQMTDIRKWEGYNEFIRSA